MKRAQIQLDEELFEILRRRAFQKKCSISAVIREILKKDIDSTRPSSPTSIRQFHFVAAGKSKQGDLEPVSERHDDALAAAFKK